VGGCFTIAAVINEVDLLIGVLLLHGFIITMVEVAKTPKTLAVSPI
jgi:hypothetical protein